jgi:hypothetical protein
MVRITFRALATNPGFFLHTLNCSIVQRAANVDGITVPTEILFNSGQHGFSIDQNGAITCDSIEFMWSKDLAYLIIMDIGNDGFNNFSRYGMKSYGAGGSVPGTSYNLQYMPSGGWYGEGAIVATPFVQSIEVDGTYVPPPPPPVGGSEFSICEGSASIADNIELCWSE